MRFRLLALLLIGVVLTGVSASIEAAEAGVAVWTEGDMLLASRPVTFAGWSARVADDAEPTLDALAAWLVAHDAVVVVEGHTSSGTDEARSVAVSRRRAERVRDALLARGCAPDRVTALGLGSSRLLVPRGAPDEFRNRRVEFRLVPRMPTPGDGPVIGLLEEPPQGGAGEQRADSGMRPRIALLEERLVDESFTPPRIPLLEPAFAAADDLIAPAFASLDLPAIRIPLLDSDGPRLELLE